MIIKKVELKHLRIPLKKTFKTALRTVSVSDNMVVLIHTDDGRIGYGEAPPTKAITGDTNESTIAAIEGNIADRIMGYCIDDIDRILTDINVATANDTSAKAAIDMAIYDLYSQNRNLPLYKVLGGTNNRVETDMTISINNIEEMKKDALDALNDGFTTLKLKVGGKIEDDKKRIAAIRDLVGPQIKIRLDANQGWEVDDAIALIKYIEDKDLDIELVEQPVKANDLEGMKKVTNSVQTQIMADESLFSLEDAEKIIQMGAANSLNIKLMKSGGIYNALKIISIAEIHGVECMIGSMVESKIGLTAAAHLAASKKNITKVDLDAAIMMAEDPIVGGFEKDIPFFTLPDKPGLGIERVIGLEQI